MKNRLTKIMIFCSVGFLISSFSFSQTGIKGKVTDEYGKELIGAYIIDVATSKGGTSDLDGNFNIEMEAGSKNLKFSFIGFEDQTMTVEIQEGKMLNLGTIKMIGSEIGLGSIDIIADRARERETPVAISNISKAKIEQQLGSRDIPLVMNVTPSVYATVGGGGAGDARINVRGFNQRNVAIMINGVPINDMENGWVYWSNWDGIADATSSIQMQRGLSAVNLATPSIGGTMNVITSPAEQNAGGSAKFEYGSGNFMKTSISGNSGLINDKYAVGVSLVRKVGNGVIDKTWTDAWAYYIGASYILNEKNRIEVYALGAPQRHGQNLYKQNVATYDSAYASGLEGIDDSTFMKFKEQGRFFNQNWGEVSNYDGKQFFNGKTVDRYDKNFINERENFYNKPLVNLNWYSQWSDKISQFTTVYYSGGKGGGTGTYGKLFRKDANGVLGDDDYKFYYGPSPWRWDFNQLITEQSSNIDTITIDKKKIGRAPGESVGIIRNSRNNQNTYGLISKAKIRINDNLKGQIGIDWRTAKIEHFREVRDLLGGDYYVYSGNEFDAAADYNKTLGDRIAYNFTNTVDWIGYYAQMEYSNDKITAYGSYGNSFIKYTYVNHFKKDPNDPNKELSSETGMMSGYQLKGGISFRPMEGFSVFGNFGLISKAPIFDNVIDDVSATVADDPQNEDFTAFEFGANYLGLGGRLDLKTNYYYTSWKNRALNISVIDLNGNEGFYFIQGMAQLHKGLEFEGNFRPVEIFSIGAMASFGNWEYTDNVSGSYKDYTGVGNTDTTITYNYYVKGLKVGDAPQTQFAGMFTVYPVNGLRMQLDVRHYSNHYADWNPFNRTDENDTGQVWKTPAYSLLDFHASYKMPIGDKYNLEAFIHIFNLLDAIYIQDAVDNSQYNGFYGYQNRLSHTVNSAEVFLGLPRTFNTGLIFKF